MQQDKHSRTGSSKAGQQRHQQSYPYGWWALRWLAVWGFVWISRGTLKR